MNHLQFIFVHGLSGWGSYDTAYRKMPYWGMRGGDLMAFLREKGFDCHAASVSPTGSAWDRACELYAQLAGTRVDYGESHSTRFRHERYGRDFSGCPLIKNWDEDTRLVLLGHSFGGATVRLFSELLAHGDPEEQRITAPEGLSPFFAGGYGKRIYSLVTLASPMNGTSVYTLSEDPEYDPSSVKVPAWSRVFTRILAMGTRPQKDNRDERDYADYDMHIDHADEMNRRITTLPHVFYFSVPCSATIPQPDGTYKPVRGIEPTFTLRAHQIGAYSGRTPGGIEIDASWRENDGLVNTISAMVPSGAPSKSLERSNIVPGIWNISPVIKGDHMWLQGGLFHRHDVRPYYLDLLTMISGCSE